MGAAAQWHRGLLGFDPVSPLKPYLGRDFEALDARLQAALACRYGLQAWAPEKYRLHKQADRLAAASEAFHVAGWSRQDMVDSLKLEAAPLAIGPLPVFLDLRPWKPWPPRLAASLFLARLRKLTGLETDLPAVDIAYRLSDAARSTASSSWSPTTIWSATRMGRGTPTTRLPSLRNYPIFTL